MHICGKELTSESGRPIIRMLGTSGRTSGRGLQQQAVVCYNANTPLSGYLSVPSSSDTPGRGFSMSINKMRRFEIFKRDGFACQYCGKRPPDVVLEVDHIDPTCKGGSDDDLNLITSCFECNRGKAGRVLSATAPKPDADSAFYTVQQEMGELRRYLDSKAARDELVGEVMQELQIFFGRTFKSEWMPIEGTWRSWVTKYRPEDIEEAIMIAWRRFYHKGDYWIQVNMVQIAKYISAVLRNKQRGDDDATSENDQA